MKSWKEGEEGFWGAGGGGGVAYKQGFILQIVNDPHGPCTIDNNKQTHHRIDGKKRNKTSPKRTRAPFCVSPSHPTFLLYFLRFVFALFMISSTRRIKCST